MVLGLLVVVLLIVAVASILWIDRRRVWGSRHEQSRHPRLFRASPLHRTTEAPLDDSMNASILDPVQQSEAGLEALHHSPTPYVSHETWDPSTNSHPRHVVDQTNDSPSLSHEATHSAHDYGNNSVGSSYDDTTSSDLSG